MTMTSSPVMFADYRHLVTEFIKMKLTMSLPHLPSLEFEDTEGK